MRRFHSLTTRRAGSAPRLFQRSHGDLGVRRGRPRRRDSLRQSGRGSGRPVAVHVRPGGQSRENHRRRGRTAVYQYDASGQLVSETTRGGKAIKYTYSSGGNRATREIGGQTTAYRYDEADRLLQAGEETFTYDANGNLVERTGPRGTMRYEYDPDDRLVKAVLPDGDEVRFGYCRRAKGFGGRTAAARPTSSPTV